MIRPNQIDQLTTSKPANQTSIMAINGKELIIGEPFEIDYFYSTLADLKAELTFKSGRQEDAQEFLSFLLNRLHEEMIKCLESLNPESLANETSNNTSNKLNNSVHLTNGSSTSTNGNEHNDNEEEDNWKEVGKKNRAFITRKVLI
jgi:ubiquitin carboxyl-terminal hydrolase 10